MSFVIFLGKVKVEFWVYFTSYDLDASFLSLSFFYLLIGYWNLYIKKQIQGPVKGQLKWWCKRLLVIFKKLKQIFTD